MCDEKSKEVQALEKELSFLFRFHMSIDEKLKALEDSYWRSHNSGYCDHIAGMLMGGIENGETEQHDLDCKYKWEVIRLLELLKESRNKNAEAYYLIVKWDYEYDKEGCWFDNDSGENCYELTEGNSYPLPHLDKKKVEIQSVTNSEGTVKAEVYVDYHTVTVCSDGEPAVAHASYSYTVAGDCVYQNLHLMFTIEKR